jgi:hypothetical protein
VAEGLRLTCGVAWCDAAREALSPLAMADHPGGVYALKEEVAAGRFKLWAATLAGDPAGWIVTSLNDTQHGLSLFIHFAAGGAPDTPLAPSALMALEAFAEGQGARRVTFWTRRTGLAKLAQANGYTLSIVAEKQVGK